MSKQETSLFRRIGQIILYVSAIAGIFSCIVAFLAWEFPKQTPIPIIFDFKSAATPSPIIITVIAPTPPPQFTYTPPPTYTRLPEPTTTPLVKTATSTPEFYQELQEAEIAPQVTIFLGSKFVGAGYVGCYNGGNYIVAFFIRNNSNRQFILRYESSGVTVEDNLGHKYAVSETGIGQCSSDRGLRSQTIDPGNQYTYLMVAFNGELGLDVKYLVITIDNISGTGPYRFRKDL